MIVLGALLLRVQLVQIIKSIEEERKQHLTEKKLTENNLNPHNFNAVFVQKLKVFEFRTDKNFSVRLSVNLCMCSFVYRQKVNAILFQQLNEEETNVKTDSIVAYC